MCVLMCLTHNGLHLESISFLEGNYIKTFWSCGVTWQPCIHSALSSTQTKNMIMAHKICINYNNSTSHNPNTRKGM